MGLCHSTSAIDTKALDTIRECERNELKLLEEAVELLIAQQEVNKQALESAEVVRNLGRKIRGHLDNMAKLSTNS